MIKMDSSWARRTGKNLKSTSAMCSHRIFSSSLKFPELFYRC